MLDHFWAGLPSVVSGGRRDRRPGRPARARRAVAPGDDEDFALACAQLLDDPAAHAAAAGRVRELAPSLRWSEVARPLVRFCRELDSRPAREPARSALARATYGQYPDILSDLRERGGLGAVARRVPASRRPPAAPSHVSARVLTPLLVTAFLCLMGGAWLMATPPGASFDEGAHYVKAIAAGRGELYGSKPGSASRTCARSTASAPATRAGSGSSTAHSRPARCAGRAAPGAASRCRRT